MVNGERVRHARELRDLTQAALAQHIGVNQSTIAQIESGLIQPSDEIVKAIALRTGLVPSFFRQDSGPDFPQGSLLFRCRASTAAREKAQAYRAAQTMFEVADKLAASIKQIPVRIPTTEPSTDSKTAAQMTRVALGLSPDKPLLNLINAVEKAGVLVLALPEKFEKVDAFSVWGSDSHVPVIAFANGKAWDRIRFSVGHELGHLVMHQTMSGSLKSLHDAADEFSAELLLPETAMRVELVPPITLTAVAKLKVRWRVSMQAIIRRAHELGIITPRQYTYLFAQLSKHGWRTREPENLDVSAEQPRALRKMIELCYGDPINYAKCASDVRLPRQMIETALAEYSGGGGLGQPMRPINDSRVISLATRRDRL
jgi:Zn-dependent peptidase ImmA (M78 family)/transcriptional regulator with XRE-family HTH domain